MPESTFEENHHSRLGGAMVRMRATLAQMMPAEQRVGDYVLAHPDETVHMSIAELAGHAKVSEGTVVRFCQTLGYKGYQSFKISLAVDSALASKIIHGEAESSDDLNTVAQKVFRSDISALQDTLSILQPEMLDRARQLLLQAKQIEFFASGTSLPIALDAYIHFLRIGLPVNVSMDAHVQAMRASLLGKGDVAFAISHSGQSREPVNCLRIAKERGASTIGITGSANSLLTQYADITLIALSSETLYREEAMASRIAQLSLVDTLYVSISLQRSDDSLESIRITGEALLPYRY